jgi:hypothetical protein
VYVAAVTIVECGQSAGNLRKQRVLRDYTPDSRLLSYWR